MNSKQLTVMYQRVGEQILVKFYQGANLAPVPIEKRARYYPRLCSFLCVAQGKIEDVTEKGWPHEWVVPGQSTAHIPTTSTYYMDEIADSAT